MVAEQAPTVIEFLKNVDTDCRICFKQKFYNILSSKKQNLHVLQARGSSMVIVLDFTQKPTNSSKSNDFAVNGAKTNLFSFA